MLAFLGFLHVEVNNIVYKHIVNPYVNPYILLKIYFLLFMTKYNSYRIRVGMFPNIFPFSPLTSYLSLLTTVVLE